MARAASIKELEEQKKALVEKNDQLREVLASRCEEFTASSFWILRGIEMAQNFLGNSGMLSMALNFLKSRVGGE